MSNSFYYFFSATSQVLAAILALFGVFVIFKIQSTKTNIIGIGESLLERLKRINSKQYASFDLPDNFTFRQFERTIENAIMRNDIKKLITTIDIITNDDYKYYGRNIHKLDEFLENLITRTIFWSIITAIVIIVCLSIIPFGQIILNNFFILYSLYGIVIISLIFIFYNLISILKESLENIKLE